MGFAVLAAIDLLRVEVDVVREAHLVQGWALGRLVLDATTRTES